MGPVGPASDNIHTASGTGTAIADCGVNHFVLGGGGSVPGGPLNLSFLIGSYPSDVSGTQVTSGEARYWTAKTLNTLGLGSSSVTAFAICSP